MSLSTALTAAQVASELYALGSAVKRRRIEDAQETSVVGPAHHKREPKGRKKFGSLTIPKSLNLFETNVVYRYQQTAPYHTARGAVPLPNVASKRVAANNYEVVCPFVMYDITSAPNYLGNYFPNVNGVGVKPGVTNYNPCFYANYNSFFINGAAPLVAYQAPGDLVIANDAKCQGPMGNLCNYAGDTQRSGNGWQLHKLDKPMGLLGDSAAFADLGTPGYASANAIVHYGAPAGSNANHQVTRGLIPPVGNRPIHRKTNVKLTLVGCTNQEVEYDISLVKFVYRPCAPDVNNLNITTGYVPTSTTSMNEPSTTLYNISVLGNDAAMRRQKLFHTLIQPFINGPNVPVDNAAYKDIQILGKRRVKIMPPTTIDKDSTPMFHDVELDFEWNTTRNYSWCDDHLTSFDGMVDYTTGTAGPYGPGFFGKIADMYGTYPSVRPEERIFLLIRARSEQKMAADGLTGWDGVPDLSGTNTFKGTVDYWGDIPTFDITIDNHFIIDRITA